MSAGKGDTPRAVNGEFFRRNFEMIFPTKTKLPQMTDLTTITVNASAWARVTRERDEAREAFHEMEDQRDFAMSEMERLQRERDEAREENLEQARLLAISADREEKLRAALQRWSKKVAREALQ